MIDLIGVYARLTSHAYRSWYAIPLRLIVGFGFMEHGYAKIARGPEKYASILQALGVPAPDLLAWVTMFIELLGGLAVFLGAFIPLVSIPMAITLLVAIFTVHLPNGFSSIKLLSVDAAGAHFGQPGYETPLLYLAALVALVVGGSGPLALDRFLLRPRRRQGGRQPVTQVDRDATTTNAGQENICYRGANLYRNVLGAPCISVLSQAKVTSPMPTAAMSKSISHISSAPSAGSPSARKNSANRQCVISMERTCGHE